MIGGFVFGISLNIGERLDNKLCHDLSNRLRLVCHRGVSNPCDAAST